jgi:hypothetical protein
MLDLTGTQVTDAGMQHLKRLPKLRQLTIGKTRVTATGLEDLRQALPNCVIRGH